MSLFPRASRLYLRPEFISELACDKSSFLDPLAPSVRAALIFFQKRDKRSQ